MSFPDFFHWYSLDAPIPPRWGHSLVTFPDFFLIFGGYSGKYLSDLWSFDYRTLKWSQVHLIGNPEARSHHSAISLQSQKRMVVFGGKGKNNRVISDLFVLEWEQKKWKMIETNGKGICGRSGHSADLLLDEYMIVYGGENVIDMDDLWILDLKTYGWKKGNVYGKAPRARKFHSSCVFRNQLFILGGCFENYESLGDIFMVDFNDFQQTQILQWTEIKFKGDFPARWGHSTIIYKNKFYIFGGKNATDLHDLLTFNLKRMEFKEVVQKGAIPSPRRRQMMARIGSTILMVGGFNGAYLNETNFINIMKFKVPSIKTELGRADVPNNDINLVCEELVFSSNKKLLMEKSQYFRACFSKPFWEDKGAALRIQSISGKVLGWILEFFDKGVIREDDNLTESDEVEIIKAAKFLLIDDLIEKMQEKMIRNLWKTEIKTMTQKKMLALYDLSVKWNLDNLLKFILLIIAIDEQRNGNCLVQDSSKVSNEISQASLGKIRKIKDDLQFWKRITDNVCKDTKSL